MGYHKRWGWFGLVLMATSLMLAPQPLWGAGAPAAGTSQVWALPTEKKDRIDVLELKDMDINDVLKLLAARSGLNIVSGKSVQGRVTMFLKDVPVRDALMMVLRSNGLAYEEQSGVVEIMPAKDYEQKYGMKFGVKTATEVFSINYAKAEDVMKMITPLLSEGGKVQFDARINKLIVTDTAPKIAQIRKVVTAIDHHDLEVMIEAKIVQVALTDGLKMGVDWQAIASHDGKQRLKLENDFSIGTGVRSITTAGTTVGTLTSDGYQFVLDMLATMADTRLVSSPRVAVINNQEAKILIGTTQPYITTSQATSTGGTTTAETVNFIDVGVKLNVTPTIHEDGYITMRIRPEISSTSTSVTTAVNKNEIPVVKKSEVDTTIRVKDGVTIIIGGLIEDKRSKEQSSIPFLGKIPLVGRVFRNDSEDFEKMETVIFLTPHIISGDVGIDPETYMTIKMNKEY